MLNLIAPKGQPKLDELNEIIEENLSPSPQSSEYNAHKLYLFRDSVQSQTEDSVKSAEQLNKSEEIPSFQMSEKLDDAK